MNERLSRKWKRFEDLAARIQRDLAPDARVTQNERVRGESGSLREIDISIRQRVGQFNLLIVIDCTDHKKPVDAHDVDAFIGLVQDVGANKGAMVAATGFTSTAKARARKAGIAIHRLVDAGDHDWRLEIRVPVLLHLRKVWTRVSIQGPAGFRAPEDESPMLCDQSGRELGTLDDLTRACVAREAARRGPGEYHEVRLCDAQTFLCRGSRCEEAVRATLALKIEPTESYLGQLDAAAFSGLTDEQTGHLVTQASRVGLNVPPPDQIRVMWERVEDPSTLAAKPQLEVEMLG